MVESVFKDIKFSFPALHPIKKIINRMSREISFLKTYFNNEIKCT